MLHKLSWGEVGTNYTDVPSKQKASDRTHFCSFEIGSYVVEKGHAQQIVCVDALARESHDMHEGPTCLVRTSKALASANIDLEFLRHMNLPRDKTCLAFIQVTLLNLWP